MRALVFLAAAVLVPSIAAADPLDGLKPKDCGPGGRVDNLVLRDRMIARQKVVLSLKLAQALAGGSLGATAAKANADCLKAAGAGGACGGDAAALQALFNDALDLVAEDQAGDAKHTVTVDQDRAPPVDAERKRALMFLDGEADWLRVACKAEEIRAAAAPAAGAGAGAAAGPSLLSRIVVGAAVSDIAQSFDKRGFATIGFAEDGKKGTDTRTADIMVGLQPIALAGKGTLDELAWTPFAEYERKTAAARADELNDLTFGASFIRGWTGPVPIVFQGEGSWQTDDRFNASLWKAEVSATPPSLPACARFVGDRTSFRCSGRFTLDYVDVGDPGDKRKLASLRDYTRVGVDLEIVFGWQMANDAVLTWRGAYQARRPIDGSDADAELWTAELGLAPSKLSHFNISLSYQAGEALTSFTPIDQFQIKLGYRH